jgi:hypothetical protein
MRVIAAALRGAGLKHLNLSDNALGEKGVRALAESFQHQVGRGEGTGGRECGGEWLRLTGRQDSVCGICGAGPPGTVSGFA